MTLISWAQRLFATTVVTTLVGCTASLPELPIDELPRLPQETAVSTVEAPVPAVKAANENTAGNVSQDVPQPMVTMELGMVVLHKDSNNPLDRNIGKNFKVLNSGEKYQTELGLHSNEPTKPVDFTTSQILVSSIGEKPTSGYEVAASKMEELDDRIVVTVVQSAPGLGCVTSQTITHPFEFVVIPSTKPIEIFERQRVEKC